MKLTDYPDAIKTESLKLQGLLDQHKNFVELKKRADISIEKIVQGLDKKICSNEAQRDINRHNLRNEEYASLLVSIRDVETEIATTKIEIKYLQDLFDANKIGLNND